MSRRRDPGRRRDPRHRRDPGHAPPLELQITRELVEEVLRTGLALQEVIVSLGEDLPASACGDGDGIETLLEMVIGSVHPAARAAGPRDCRAATALVGAIRERVLTDLRIAADLARERQ